MDVEHPDNKHHLPLALEIGYEASRETQVNRTPPRNKESKAKLSKQRFTACKASGQLGETKVSE